MLLKKLRLKNLKNQLNQSNLPLSKSRRRNWPSRREEPIKNRKTRKR